MNRILLWLFPDDYRRGWQEGFAVGVSAGFFLFAIMITVAHLLEALWR